MAALDDIAFTSVVILVGLTATLKKAVPDFIAAHTRTSYYDVDFQDLEPSILNRTRAQVVVSPVVSETFDALDVASRLAQLKYQGGYMALTTELPNPALIEREVRAEYPALNFKVISLSALNAA